MKYFVFLSFLLLFLTPISTVLPQIDIDLSPSVDIEIIPENPAPKELVTLILSSSGTDLNVAQITWRINGKTIQSGTGIKEIEFTTGEQNVASTISVSIQTKEGQTVNRSFTIKPSQVDILWQSESYVPPFYKGKALHSHQNLITFIAIPHITNSSGIEIASKNLVYTWKKDRKVVSEASGYGKNTYTTGLSIISRDLDIEVEVTNPNSNSMAVGRAVFPTEEPIILMYEKNPLYGIQFQKALTNTVVLDNSPEITVVGFPFFVGVKTHTSSDLSYTWAINGNPIPSQSELNKNLQVFRKKEGTSGTSKISLSIENTNKVLQLASQSFNLSFKD